MDLKINYKSKNEMSESFLTAAFLSISGGLQDMYTYIARGHVFANAQTGNIVLMSGSLYEGNFSKVFAYFIPILFFSFGVIVAEFIRNKFKSSRKVHWRQRVLIIEIFLLFIVGFLPEKLNLIANSLVSFSCAMQVQTFRKVNGHLFASTMCIGNIRSGTEALFAYFKTKNKNILEKSIQYFGIIFLFAGGAVIGGRLIGFLGLKTIWISCFLLFLSFMLMFIKSEIEEHPDIKEEINVIEEEIKKF